MANVKVSCPCSQYAQVYQHGKIRQGNDRFHCRNYYRVFQLIFF
ncbi:hypothetical protein J4198_005324 [Salmonella enterica]|nr:hypothetical protein [Salmonella enterica]EHG4041487.1 hypothetical protein [Salmonella enterica]EHG6848595.1 hypothetical protein [Salmonella enterica]